MNKKSLNIFCIYIYTLDTTQICGCPDIFGGRSNSSSVAIKKNDKQHQIIEKATIFIFRKSNQRLSKKFKNKTLRT